MIEQQGRIIRLSGNEATVEVGLSSGCLACDAGSGCGAGIFARLLPRNPVLVQVCNSIGAGAGQFVTLGIPESIFLRVLWRLYLLPLLSALAGAGVGQCIASALHAGAAIADGASFLGAAIAFLLVVYLGRSREYDLSHASNIQLCSVLRDGSTLRKSG